MVRKRHDAAAIGEVRAENVTRIVARYQMVHRRAGQFPGRIWDYHQLWVERQASRRPGQPALPWRLTGPDAGYRLSLSGQVRRSVRQRDGFRGSCRPDGQTHNYPAGGRPGNRYLDLRCRGDFELWRLNRSRRPAKEAPRPGYSARLIKFDLSSIPAGSTINSATMSLYQHAQRDTSTPQLGIYDASQAWTEGSGTGTVTADGATWQSYDGVGNWSAAGGDFNGSAQATAESLPQLHGRLGRLLRHGLDSELGGRGTRQ